MDTLEKVEGKRKKLHGLKLSDMDLGYEFSAAFCYFKEDGILVTNYGIVS